MGHVTLSDNQWGTAPMFHGVQDVVYAGQGNVWSAFFRMKSLVRQAYEGKASLQVWHDLALEHIVHVTLDVEYAILSSIAGTSTKAARHPVEPCSTPLPIQDGASIRAWGTQCKLRGPCGYSDVMTSRCFWGWSPSMPIVVWSEHANPVVVWFLEVAHYVDASRCSQYLTGDV